MPCSVEDEQYEMKMIKAELDKVTRLLCEVMSLLDAETKGADRHDSTVFKLYRKMSTEVLNWWKVHKTKDRLRAEREKVDLVDLGRKIEDLRSTIIRAQAELDHLDPDKTIWTQMTLKRPKEA